MYFMAQRLRIWPIFAVAAVTTVFDHQHAATWWCGGQGHASLTVRSQYCCWTCRLELASIVNIRNIRSHSAFCRQLKTYLFTVNLHKVCCWTHIYIYTIIMFLISLYAILCIMSCRQCLCQRYCSYATIVLCIHHCTSLKIPSSVVVFKKKS